MINAAVVAEAELTSAAFRLRSSWSAQSAQMLGGLVLAPTM
jgi:hypothetical protein